MLESLLIANRGEIACRIIRTARRLGIRTVAVYSDADAGARHVRLADEAVRIGPAAARESYLVVENLIAAARKTGARAIHPGYGFLSENPALADACEAAGIVFVGPRAASIRAMGSKSASKALMEKAKVPTTPGYHGDDQGVERLKAEAVRIGFPVLIKASAGGGGKGMRRVDRAEDVEAQLASCRREALSAFGSDEVLIEKYVERPRHIEVQVFGDTHGNHVFLFERDCSVQRRHQKVLEEAPAPGMTAALRARMGETAVLAAKAVDYVGAGTVEFIADPSGNFYFMEMNTRLQVEHPVTEEVTGLDLVEWQLRVASGEKLPKAQGELSLHGHAIEARVYAENPDQGFIPSVGRLVHLVPPEPSRHVRVDTGVEQGDEITPFYDPMIAKLIVWGSDRDEALRHLREALARYQVVGVANNIEFLGRLARTRSFSQADLDTSLIEREREALKPPEATVPDDVWLLGAAAELARARARSLAAEPGSPWALLDGFRLGSVAPHLVTLRSGEAVREVRAEFLAPGTYSVRQAAPGAAGSAAPSQVRLSVGADHAVVCRVDARTVHGTVVPVGDRRYVFFEGRRWELERFDPLDVEASSAEVEGGLRAPMPGKVIALLVEPGTRVAKGAPLVVMEAMKMEITIQAPHAGVVASFRHQVGEQVSEGTELAVIEEKAS
ncbi:acetyl/propionyl/methylcrotonyl-CoA carboxylase subunit alpha [Myxococcus sp. K15C18031901]|uniref:acetyl/propionyl/methylcrotonyl-CoA carboxylase subunit alpha n=1 Tax=Myxococcus dinghuensis TaxID=2906761 RepID=UPI0020A7D820|nr:acetyl/propionyl/methylcrotonyl-CoA carboxylase subunit alpha [Myxococcus dinghuensis]MCP3098808.1 acetyl/propionyl/methylcrotonyl-CoA carboxylase subunit alpha [Myxococcus dinghuensis]